MAFEFLAESDFRKKIKADPSGNYLFFGSEDYLKSKAVDIFKDAMNLEPSFEVFNFVKLDVLDYSDLKLADLISAPPMMAEKKLIILWGLDIGQMKQSDFSNLCDTLSTLNDYDYNNFVLVLPNGCIDEGYLPKKPSSELTTLSKYLTPVYFEAPSIDKIMPWIATHLKKGNISCDNQTLRFIADYCGNDLFVLSAEIEKLIFYLSSKGLSTFDIETVKNVMCEGKSFDNFEFANSILAQNYKKALNTLQIMKFKQIDPIIILSELTKVFTDLFKVKMLLVSGENSASISKKLGMHEYKATTYSKTASGMEISRLKSIISALSNTDISIKLSGDGYRLIETLICSL